MVDIKPISVIRHSIEFMYTKCAFLCSLPPYIKKKLSHLLFSSPVMQHHLFENCACQIKILVHHSGNRTLTNVIMLSFNITFLWPKGQQYTNSYGQLRKEQFWFSDRLSCYHTVIFQIKRVRLTLFVQETGTRHKIHKLCHGVPLVITMGNR